MAELHGRFFASFKADGNLVNELNYAACEVCNCYGDGLGLYVYAHKIPCVRIEPVDAWAPSSGRFLFAKFGQIALRQHFVHDARCPGDAGLQFFCQIVKAVGHAFFAKKQDCSFLPGILAVDVA